MINQTITMDIKIRERIAGQFEVFISEYRFGLNDTPSRTWVTITPDTDTWYDLIFILRDRSRKLNPEFDTLQHFERVRAELLMIVNHCWPKSKSLEYLSSDFEKLSLQTEIDGFISPPTNSDKHGFISPHSVITPITTDKYGFIEDNG
jgi:hypothetical protein